MSSHISLTKDLEVLACKDRVNPTKCMRIIKKERAKIFKSRRMMTTQRKIPIFESQNLYFPKTTHRHKYKPEF